VRPVRRVVLDDSNDTKNRSGNYNINGSITAHGLNTDGGDVSFTEDTGTTPKFFWDAGSEELGIGTSSPERKVHINDSTTAEVHLTNDVIGSTSSDGGTIFVNNTGQMGIFNRESAPITLHTNSTERVRIDSSGNLLVGTTAPVNVNSGANTGLTQYGNTGLHVQRSGGPALHVGRLGGNGRYVEFRTDGDVVGRIANATGDNLMIYQSAANGCGLGFYAPFTVRPVDNNGQDLDDTVDLGRSTTRFDDIFATNGTIQTSDVNEKQDIDVLSEAETRVASKAKTLLRKYRWKSAVEEKGDEARIHFGIIAQDLEQAFIDEGLDAGRYGMFIRGEWYEAEVEKTRTVENDDGTETTETYMATETYDTAEEAPDGAVHKERLGVRYHELLAFIIAAI